MDAIQQKHRTISSRTISLVSLIIVMFVLCASIYFVVPTGPEWATFRPAALALWSGHSPYTIPGYYNSPWLLFPIVPFAILPEHLGFSLFATAGLLAFAYTAYRLGARPWGVVAILFSYPVTLCLYRGQVDWLVLLGSVLPPQIGLFLVLSKPQIGVGIAIFWLIEAFRTGGVKQVLRVFTPVSPSYLASIPLFGLWLLPPIGIETNPINISFWPLSIPVGLALLVLANRTHHLHYSILASPFFSPYLCAYSLPGVLLGLAEYPLELIAVSSGLWIWQLIRMVG